MADPAPTISVRVLDLVGGEPAPGVGVALFRLADDGAPELLSDLVTDADGRVDDLLDGGQMAEGDYQLAFDIGVHADDPDAFLQSLAVALRITDSTRSYHLPVLLSPYGVSVYREG